MIETIDRPSIMIMIEPISSDCYRLSIRSKSKFKANGLQDNANHLLYFEFADILCANCEYISNIAIDLSFLMICV
jgi:hypothetical protein